MGDKDSRQQRTRLQGSSQVLLPPVEPSQFTSWGFSERAVNYGLLPSMGTIGDCFDNAVIESFWSRVQVELGDRQS